ncbi:cytochrome c oxidase cbb3-type subunit 3 [Nonlabens dokdonensis]|uniref:Cytochrome c oxidase (Chain III) n=2 Tax=Nonlabens dokdonensis TaxID=328515 RepID=L7W1I8_NONDD|nr:cbb3-type cytochrome c oxidase N-terminal domain-containing protein [Nonlabens dokdonensis]AGC75325.1 cytochrome c oxidase (Chain III) [Nonlabens dokdonensis DSW-6]PZX43033.1 cytochrome c oxidase cbb3-type subunit 3 [Nonlabens dokdonensis]
MNNTGLFIRTIAFAVLGYFFFNWIGSTEDATAFENLPWLWVVYGVIILFYIAGEASLGALSRVLYASLKPDAQKKYDENIAFAKANQFKWIKNIYKKSLGSKAVEEEHEIILDHNYDGIKELDNNLPPWWVYMFYATILFAVVYLVRFEIFNNYDQDEEYETAVAAAQIEIDEWKKTAKNLVDVNTVVLLTDAADINAGKVIFQSNCVACHKADGGGGIGPNLTDRNWILGGGIKNVFNTISEGGRSGKGMVAWKQDLKPLEMAQVASYVLTFEGTTPAEPKAAEGEIWTDPDAPQIEEQINEIITDSLDHPEVEIEELKVVTDNN